MFAIKIVTGNAAFHPDPKGEIHRILAEITNWVELDVYIPNNGKQSVYDISGNYVGYVEWTHNPEDDE